MSIDPTRIPRYEGSRIPGWDDAVDLEKDPAVVPDPATTPVPDDLRAEIEAAVAPFGHERRQSASIPALYAVQKRYGWCSPEGIEQAACVLQVTPGELIAVASFYDMLETRPVGRNRVYVCTNISCSLCGADELLAAFQEQIGEDPDFNLRGFECLGACDIAPMASINGEFVGPIDVAEVPTVVRQIRAGEQPLPAKQMARRRSVDPKVQQS